MIKIECVEDLATVAHQIDISLEDFGIGGYEYAGAKGNDVQVGAVTDETSVEVLLPPDLLEIPVFASAQRSIGGCDGDHAGRCNHEQIDVRISLRLESVRRVDDRYAATYSVELE